MIKLTKDITDNCGDSDLFVPAGTVVALVSKEDGYLIVEVDGLVFPVTEGEYEDA